MNAPDAPPPPDPHVDEGDDAPETSAISTRSMEMVTALVLLAFGALIMWDSSRLGSGWGSDGPQAGYFPFYVGLLLCLCCGVIFFKAWRGAGANKSFVSREKLRLVLAMFWPTLVYLLVMQWLGLYVASALFIAFFMRWQGKYGWGMSVGVALGVVVALFLMFEVWFQVPLYKGPLEAMLGY